MRRRFLSLIARVVGTVLPDRILTLLKSTTVMTRELDYPRRRVMMAVDSPFELAMRLTACQREPETVEWIERDFRSGDVFFDIGANVGPYALVAAACHGGGVKTYAFEPACANYAQLCRNVSLNGFEKLITAVPVALSDRTGIDALNYTTFLPGGALHTLHGDRRAASDGPFKALFSQGILTFTLDTFVEQFNVPIPTHVKLDVDGAEVRVLQGAARTLSHPAVRTVMVEVDEPKGDGEAIGRFLHDRGFAITARYVRTSGATAFEGVQRWLLIKRAN